ncbi:hypothetical protein HMPREF1022_01281 [Desulfovibrio sp. 6_1_46AFAA]|uniref:non-ribosomal peptide synthetase n=1 Tax=Desulfovibrio sp. 6_1_46AFAA TaxID=665942 RepID=UPI0002236EEC|nr:non-ribosomal peptide synthetase [Desulfovibrio sp. 6_1_46AFAA]EGW51740.1 hypothetical protein HMPREF1022_01281 [Desulfovibrio sp. 6_1_46AFAA]
MNNCAALISSTATRLPGKTALVCGDHSMSFAQLEHKARRLASGLQTLGLERGSILPILLPRDLEVAVALLGAWKAGLAPCILDTGYPPDRLAAIRAQCGTKHLLDVGMLQRLEALPPAPCAPLANPAPTDPGLAVFTSGSTGRPKGVLLPHRALTLATQGNMTMLREDDQTLSTASHSFIAIMVDLVAPLALGATVHIAGDDIRRDAALIAAYVRCHGITAALLSPQMAAPFLELADDCLRCLFTGTERVRRLWSERTRIVNLYGASETCGPLASFRIDKAYDNTPLGMPYPGSRIFVLDEEGRSVPEGEEGEICVCGQTALGYLQSPELTAERFVPNPYAASEADAVLFKTGDIGRMLPDGNLEYVQRKDWLLKIRGFRVEPGEIEAVMLRTAPLEKAVVTGFEDSSGQMRLYACYTAAAPVDAGTVLNGLAAVLPDYMLPSFMEQVDALPLNANGKIDRSRIAPPDIERYRAVFAAPETELENALCVAFGRVLGLEKIGLDDDFLQLGGDSISAVRLQALLPDTGISAAMLFTERTPRALAEALCRLQTAAPAAPLREVPDREAWPLTFAERQMAAEQTMDPSSVAYNVNLALSIEGGLDEARLERALASMVRRQRILRSFYPMCSGGHVHCLDENIHVRLGRETCPEEAVADRIRALNTPFDLAHAPLFRFTLFETGPDTRILHMCFHHIIMDGLSAPLVLATLWEAYEKDTSPESVLPARPDYLDFAVRQQEEGEPDTAFFSALFSDGVPENEMPTRPVRPERLPCANASVARRIPFAGLEREARRLGVTPYTLLMAAFSLTLAKYCGSEDVVLGAAMNCRDLPETGAMAGMFVNTLPVRLQPAGTLGLHDYIRQTGILLGNIRAHQSCPFSLLVPLLAPERNASRAPVFDVIVNYLEEAAYPDAAGLRISPYPVRTQELAIDLTLEMRRRDDALNMELLYSDELYESAVVSGMLEHFAAVLERVCDGTDMTLADAAELAAGQRRQILEDFAGPDTGPAPGRTVVDAFIEQARVRPDKRAAAFGEEVLSYAEMDALTDRLARLLADKGIGGGATVGILVRRGLMMPVGALGVLKSGAAYVPLDPTYPTERLEFMLQDSGAALLIADEGLEGQVPGFAGEILATGVVWALAKETPAPDPLPVHLPRPDDLMVLLYTSGTTGKPKGVMLSHANLTNFCDWFASRYDLGPSDAVAAYASFGFDACLMDMFPALSRGACIWIIPEEMRLDLPAMNAAFEEQGVTLAFLTTQLGRQFAATMRNRSLRALSTGGETLVPVTPPDDYALCNLYGPTECTICISSFRVDSFRDRVPLGKALDNTRLYILDKHGRLAPVGTAGELCVAGRQVAQGYLNRPELTAEKFTPNPFSDAPDYARIYRTGDMVRWLPDGSLDFVGRQDFQIKIRGFRVELTEIEGRIRQHPDIVDAAVVPMDAPGGGKCAVAYVVTKTPGAFNAEDLNAFIEEQLPPYMVPAATMRLEHIPLNPNGKVDRKKLPPPDFSADEKAGEDRTSGPETLLESTLKDILRQVLGHAQFSLTSNLLRAGLTSLSTIRLAALLDERLGIAPSVREILADPSMIGLENALVGALLRRAEQSATTEQQEDEAAVPSPASPSGTGCPLTHNQLGVYFDCLKRPDTLAYNIPLRLDLPETVDAGRLAVAVAAVLDAHPALKTRLSAENERPAFIPLEAKASVPCLEMSDEELEAHASAFTRPFDLFAGPLYRAEVIRAPRGVSLLLDAHHLVFDGASLDIFLHSLGAAYERGELPRELREKLTAQDWALEEARQEDGPEWREDKAYFDSLLENFEAASELPSDLPPTGEIGKLAEAVRAVDGPKVERFCREHGLTPAGLYLAATAYAVSRWTQSPDAWLSTISSGRSDARLRNTFGMFVRTLPVHLGLGENLSRLEYMRAAHKALSGSVSHESYPYTRICEEHGFAPAIMYACELGVTGGCRLEGHPLSVTPLSMPEPKFKLSVHVERRGNETVFAVQYDDARYSPWLMTRFADTLATALDNLISEPDAPVRGVSLVSEEQAALLARFRITEGELPEPVLHRMFEAAAARCPDSPALIAGEEQYDYARLNAEANRLAHGLLSLGVQPEDRVAFVLRRTGRILIAMLGALKAGCAYIPMDPEYPAERIAHVLDDSGARFVLTDAKDAETAARLAGMPGLLDIDGLRAGRETHNPDLPVTPEQLAYLIYTSGSTGKPKGVMLRHGGIANYVTAHPRNLHVAALASDARAMLSVTTAAFDMFLKESMTALCNGLTLVLADDDEARDPVRLAELFARTGADAFNATPSRLLEYTEYPPLLEALSRCRVLMAGAEKYPDALLARLRQGRARLFNTYGPTEITVSCNGKELTGTDRVTVGAPLLNVHEYVLDDDGNMLPCGMIGELLVGGAGVARGYNNLPEQTAARFVTFNGERVYKTGDYARWTGDGEIVILGRNDNQIKLRGLRIELGEVERALAALTGVKACVAGIRTLNGMEHLCAWYTGGDPDPQALREQLASTLPPYMVPTAWARLDAMPTLPNGKTDARSLPDPEPLRTTGYVAPETELEGLFCSIYATVLGLERVGALDSFFEIGGSSLAVTRVLIEAGRLGVRGSGGEAIAYADVFAHPTPRALATLLTGNTAKSCPARQTAVKETYDYDAIHSLLAQNTLDAFRTGTSRPLGNVLLTGATGFLGSHMLHILLQQEQGKICCLLRRGRYDSVEKRLKQILYYYFEDTFDELFGRRLLVLEGDITDAATLARVERLSGFSPDTIINCAANVSHFAANTGISDVNLGGVQQLVGLALRTGARLVQISTTSVAGFSIDGTPPPDTSLSEQDIFLGQSLENQYAHSKFLAERTMLEAVPRGLDAKIMRVGNLMARNRDGEFQINLRSNSFIGRLRAYHAIGCFPYSSFLHQTELAPIDSTARAVLLLATAPSACRIFHPFNNHSLFMGDIIASMQAEGLEVPMVEDDVFERAMAEAMLDPDRAERLVSLVAYQNMAGGKVVAPLAAESAYTAQALLRHNWRWPETGSAYLRGFIQGLAGMGFFDL